MDEIRNACYWLVEKDCFLESLQPQRGNQYPFIRAMSWITDVPEFD